MKKFTKLMAALLVLTMMLSLVACAGNEKPAETTAPATTEPAPTEEVTEPVDVYTGPDWEAISAMDYDEASDALYEYIIDECRKQVPVVETGRFGADMKVSLVNDGPFTVILDSEDLH